ncbi:thioredoxin [Tenacibaculum amylolyticum]|uniref:thioredoxin n=1 Tax=Tenacibaculum amylolyticum TaxID=104269 RepID=UPI0038957906
MDIQLDQKDFQTTIENKRNVLIDFYADWCGPCQTLLPTVEKLAKEYEGEVTIKKVNVDQNQQLAAAFGVRSIPTLVQLTDGKEIGRIVGLVTEKDLRSKLDKQKSA